MKNYFYYILLIVGLPIFFSCASTKEIQKNMTSKSNSMSYIMDSKIADVKNNITISLDTVCFKSNVMSDTTKVKRIKAWFLPLVLVYVWHSENKCIQGKSMFEENIPKFLRKSTADEINRSGNFNLDTLGKPNYKIELSIDAIKTEGLYISGGFFYFALFAYGFSYSDRAVPAISELTISYKLKSGDQVVYSNSFQSKKNTKQINKRYTNTAILQKDYAASMVEATSYNFKNVIQLIVNDVNDYFSKHN